MSPQTKKNSPIQLLRFFSKQKDTKNNNNRQCQKIQPKKQNNFSYSVLITNRINKKFSNLMIRYFYIIISKKIKRLNQKLIQKQKAFVKLMNDKERQKREQEELFNQKIQACKKEINSLQSKIFQTQSKFKAQISDIRRSNKQQISKAIQHQQNIAEQNLQKQKRQYAEQKRNLIQAQNKQRSQLIKKYQTKLQDLRDAHEQQTFKLTSEHNQIHQKDRKIKADLQNQIVINQNSIKKLQGELNKQTLGHQKYKISAQSLSQQLAQFNKKHAEQIQSLTQQIRTKSSQFHNTQKRLKTQLHSLRQLLLNTIKQKDVLFEQTVSTMKTQHHIQIQTLKNDMMEQKEIELNETQTKHYMQMQKQSNQFYALQKKYLQLQQKYQVIKDQYQSKIAKIIQQYEDNIEGIQSRNTYQLQIEGQSSKKSTKIIQRKYKLQIKALKKQYEQMKQQLTKKVLQQRITTTNKLTTHYDAMINDIKVNNDVGMKQKLIEFDRKSKGYEKKLTEAEKRRTQLKIQLDRQKLDFQMKVDGLSDANERLELQIEDLHQHMMKLQKQKTKIINEYEFKLLVKGNQLRQVKDQYQIKQQQLRNILNQNISIKNLQIQKFSQKVNTQVQDLINKHNKRVAILQKQYSQLKKVMNQRTSLPEDVEALKVFHKCYVKLEQQLQNQKRMKVNVQRQLKSKCEIQKVFVSKTSFVPKVQEKMPIKIVTMREFYNSNGNRQKDVSNSKQKPYKQKQRQKDNSFRLVKFKSQNL